MGGRKKRQVDEVLGLLCARWPKCFFAYEARRRPLKIGIHHELETILGESVERKLLHLTIKVYVANSGYLQAQLAGTARIDLDGEPAGAVTERQAERARKTLAGRLEIKRQKRREEKEKKLKPKPEPKPERRRDGLASLREAAARRQRQATGGRT